MWKSRSGRQFLVIYFVLHAFVIVVAASAEVHTELLVEGEEAVRQGDNDRAVDLFNHSLSMIQPDEYLPDQARLQRDLGYAYRNLNDFQKALFHYRKALKLDMQLNSDRVVLDLGGIGHCHIRLGNYNIAFDYFVRALDFARRVDDKSFQQRSLVQITDALSYLALSARADQELDLAGQISEVTLPLAQEFDLPEIEGNMLQTLGVVHQDNPTQAIAYLEAAVEAHRAAEDHLGEAQDRAYLGDAYFKILDLEQSLEHYTGSFSIARILGEQDLAWNARANISVLNQFLRGFYLESEKRSNFDKMLEYGRLGLDAASTLEDQESVSFFLTGIGSALMELNACNEALSFYKRALDIDRTQLLDIGRPQLNRQYVALDLSNIGNAYACIRDYAEALKYYEEALSIRLNELQDAGAAAKTQYNMGALYGRQGDHERALKYMQDSHDGRDSTDINGRLRALIGMGNAYVNLERADQAENQFGDALEFYIEHDIQALDFYWQILTGLSGANELQGSRDAAILYGKLAVNVLQNFRGRLTDLTHYLQQSFLTVDRLDPYIRLAQLLIAEGRFPEAEQILVMVKEYEQLEFIRGDVQIDSTIATQATLTEREQFLANQLNATAKRLSSLHKEQEGFLDQAMLNAEDRRRRTEVREAVAAESERLSAFLADVAIQLKATNLEKDLRIAEMVAGTVRDVLNELHRSTGSNPAVLYVLPAENQTYFLLNTVDGFVVAQGGIGASALYPQAQQLRLAIARRDLAYRSIAGDLYEVLIRPVSGLLEDANVDTLMLYLVGPLRYVPFSALWDGENEEHLIEQFGLTFHTAASMANLKDRPLKQWTAVGLGVSKTHSGYHPLPAVVEELNSVVREEDSDSATGILSGDLYLDDAFTRERLHGLLEGGSRYAIMHIATHFSLAPGNERNSQLLLGDGDELSLHEIRTDQGIRLGGYELVTLSACDTAVSSGSQGEEVEGLGVILQRKGAKSVLATLWKVQDEGTAQFMESFYLARGEEQELSKATALQEAQIAMLSGKVSSDNAQIDLSLPYYWAPFVLMGNWM